MKKIIISIIFLSGFISMAQSHKSHVFYSIIHNQGTITENLASQNCDRTFTFQQLRGRFYVNISIATPLQPNKFYQLDFGRGLNYYYLTYSGTNEHPDEDYRVDSQSASIVQYDCDSDGDGISDSQDNCPNQAGPASNNGCPGNPELSIDLNGSTISSDCSNCDNIFNSIGSDRHYLVDPTGIANIDVFVKNTGSVSSSASTVGFYVSNDNVLQGNSDSRIKTVNVSSLSPNSGKYASTSLFVPDFNSVGGNFWLLIKVDDSNANQESNENNNVFALRFAIN
ncbi:CARDB domain-containing protein [Flagellimonas onchidii]|uniref:CARDB domain-containing protein n=1 Tax=Flagellimonas onchidii TaxID=2562684 RepID=UPI0010A5FF9D|nr:CARDB domain-containing protein [Allomuricauda onchidii]